MPPAKRAARKPQAGGNAPHAAAWRLLLPFLMFGVAALAAALHKVVGEPLGAAATAKLAEFWQFMALASLGYGPLYAQYSRNHALAQRTEQRQMGGPPADAPTLTGEEAAHDHDDDGPARRLGHPRRP